MLKIDSRQSPLLYAFCCFPPASPAFARGAGKQKTAPKDRPKHLIFLKKIGAGEGIRTLDPNLGKVNHRRTRVVRLGHRLIMVHPDSD
jgi:hypothetical protein